MAIWTSFNFCKIICGLLVTSILIAAQEKPHCRRDSWSFFGGKCCGNDSFSYDHLKQFLQVCTVRPKNVSLSVGQSHWKFLDCLLTKYLENKPLTLENFVDVMTANLTDTSRKSIQDSTRSLKEPGGGDGKAIIKPKSEIDKLNFLESLWKKYFDAEYDVCFGNDLKLSNKTVTPRKSRAYWDPLTRGCGNETFPTIDESLWNKDNFHSNRKSLREKYARGGNLTYFDLNCIDLSCFQISSARIAQSELEDPALAIDFENKAKSLVNPLLSQSSVDMVMKQVNLILAQRTGGQKNDTLAMSIERLNQSAQTWINSNNVKAGLNEICVKATTLNDVANAVSRAERRLCYFSSG